MDNSDILEILPLESWRGPFTAETQSRALQALETGKVVVLPHLPFTVEANETKFLAPSISGDARKNISFDPQTRKISNTALDQDGAAQLTAMMDRFGGQASQLLRDLIPSYASRLVRARTSYRPQEIEGRVYPPRQDDTRLHVDAFPSRPARGAVFCACSRTSPVTAPRVAGASVNPFRALRKNSCHASNRLCPAVHGCSSGSALQKKNAAPMITTCSPCMIKGSWMRNIKSKQPRRMWNLTRARPGFVSLTRSCMPPSPAMQLSNKPSICRSRRWPLPRTRLCVCSKA